MAPPKNNIMQNIVRNTEKQTWMKSEKRIVKERNWEYVKFCEQNKYKDYLEKERECKQIGKYKITHLIYY